MKTAKIHEQETEDYIQDTLKFFCNPGEIPHSVSVMSRCCVTYQPYVKGLGKEAAILAYSKLRFKIRREIERDLGIGFSMLATRYVAPRRVRGLPIAYNVLGCDMVTREP